MASISPLRQLADLISASVDKIEAQLEQERLSYPSLDDPCIPASPAEVAATKPEIMQAALVITSACGQLSAVVKNPFMTLLDTAGGFHVSSCLRAALEGNIVEILREAGPQGLHSKDISARNGVDQDKISRVLRMLATHYVFRETSPNVFVNNRLSSMLDTLKPDSEIMANPKEKHVGTPGLSAVFEHTTDEVQKASAYMTDALLDPTFGHSIARNLAPLNMAFKTDKPWWEWLEEPGNEHRLKRFSAAMDGTTRASPLDASLQGYDWSTLAPKSVVVDVGGGIGSTTIRIAKRYPELQFIVQDRSTVVEQGEHYWKKEYPVALENGSVQLQVHDFFTPQPVRKASVFFLRMILHDYGRENAIEILKHLREAATLDTVLVIEDQIISYACPDETLGDVSQGIPGAAQIGPPTPLLANWGKGNSIAYIADMQMYVALNGEERTLGAFLDITRASGWKMKQVFTIPGFNKHILAVPA